MQKNKSKMLSWLRRKPASFGDRKEIESDGREFIEEEMEGKGSGEPEAIHRELSLLEKHFSRKRTTSLSSSDTHSSLTKKYVHTMGMTPTLQNMADNPMIGSPTFHSERNHSNAKQIQLGNRTTSSSSLKSGESKKTERSEGHPSDAEQIRLGSRTSSGTSLKGEKKTERSDGHPSDAEQIRLGNRTSSGTSLKKGEKKKTERSEDPSNAEMIELGNRTASGTSLKKGGKQKIERTSSHRRSATRRRSPSADKSKTKLLSRKGDIGPTSPAGASLRVPKSTGALLRKYPCPIGGQYFTLPSQLILQFLTIEDWKCVLKASREGASGRLFEFLDPVPTPQSVINASAFVTQCTSWVREIRSENNKNPERQHVPIDVLRLHCVSLCSLRGDVGEAKSMLQLETSHPVGFERDGTPDEALVAPLLKAARIEQNAEVAYDVFQAVKNRSCETDICLWNSILAAFSSNIAFFKYLPDALEEMDREGFEPDDNTCKIMCQVLTSSQIGGGEKRISHKSLNCLRRSLKACYEKIKMHWPNVLKASVNSRRTEGTVEGTYKESNVNRHKHVASSVMEEMSDTKEEGRADEDSETCYSSVPHTVFCTLNPMVVVHNGDYQERENDEADIDGHQFFSTYFQSPWLESSTVSAYRPLSILNQMESESAYNKGYDDIGQLAPSSSENAYFVLPSGIVDADVDCSPNNMLPSTTVNTTEVSSSSFCSAASTSANASTGNHNMHTSAVEFKPLHVNTCNSLSESVQRIVESTKMSLPARRNEGLLPTPSTTYSNPLSNTYCVPTVGESPEEAHRCSRSSMQSRYSGVSQSGMDPQLYAAKANSSESDSLGSDCWYEYGDPHRRRLSNFSTSYMSSSWRSSSERSIASFRSSAACSEQDSYDGRASFYSQSSNPRVLSSTNNPNWEGPAVHNPAVPYAAGGLLRPPKPGQRKPSAPPTKAKPRQMQHAGIRRTIA